MTKHFCDVCGDEIPEHMPDFVTSYSLRIEHWSSAAAWMMADLSWLMCRDCGAKVDGLLRKHAGRKKATSDYVSPLG